MVWCVKNLTAVALVATEVFVGSLAWFSELKMWPKNKKYKKYIKQMYNSAYNQRKDNKNLLRYYFYLSY